MERLRKRTEKTAKRNKYEIDAVSISPCRLRLKTIPCAAERCSSTLFFTIPHKLLLFYTSFVVTIKRWLDFVVLVLFCSVFKYSFVHVIPCDTSKWNNKFFAVFSRSIYDTFAQCNNEGSLFTRQTVLKCSKRSYKLYAFWAISPKFLVFRNTRTIEHEMLSQTNDQNVNIKLRLPLNISQTNDCYSAKKKLKRPHWSLIYSTFPLFPR